jgi:hypothetical protein
MEAATLYLRFAHGTSAVEFNATAPLVLQIHHLFCATCGIQSFARGAAPDGTVMVAINVRCLDGVDVKSLSPIEHDGASH